MVNVSKFVKDHTLLCVCTFGLAIIGYLGYHAVRCIINKCQSTEKIDRVGQKNINNQPSSDSPKCLINRLSNLEISQDKITMGQGEYVAFHKLPSGEKKELSPETFEQVYKILVHYSPAALINSGSEQASKDCANRYESIKSKVKEIDSSLEIIFVPRTLIELIFIRKCIKEDLKHKGICSSLSKLEQGYFNHPEKYRIFKNEEPEEREKTLGPFPSAESGLPLINDVYNNLFCASYKTDSGTANVESVDHNFVTLCCACKVHDVIINTNVKARVIFIKKF